MVTGTAALKQHLYDLRWRIMWLIVAVVLILAGLMFALSTWGQDLGPNAPVAPLPAVTSPLPSNEPPSVVPQH
ncbi:hypothetical protein [Nocardia heshunensis]